MVPRRLRLGFALGGVALAASAVWLFAQEPTPPPPPVATTASEEEAPAKADAPAAPKGVEVLTRGPIHEAYATLTADPTPAKPVDKKPPKPLEELPPAEKPEGDVVWIGGYWAWDDDRKDFLWVSGIWRKTPPTKQWIAGYWREEGDQWQWVAGFWTAAAKAASSEEEAPPAKEVTYLPAPPAAPETAPPGKPPQPDSFYVPGSWVWTGNSYAWRAGFWTKVQPNFVWVPDHYRWTPSGYVYIAGYWDYTISRRGILYAPVVVDPAVVTASFYYTPAYAVSDTVVVDALFVRPATAHYYFGDYYGPTYVALGYESGFVYSQRRYDSIVVYETWEHRSQPGWVGIQIDIYSGRSAGRLPTPPRTLVQQNTIIQNNITNNTTIVTNNTTINNNSTTINNNTTKTVNYTAPVVAPAAQVAAAKGVKTTTLDTATRVQARQQAAALQQVAVQRTQAETPLPPGAPRQARVASLSVPQTKPVQPGFTAPRVAATPAAPVLRPATTPSTPAARSNPAAGGAASPSGWSNPGTGGATAGRGSGTPAASPSRTPGTGNPTTTGRPTGPPTTSRPPVRPNPPPRPAPPSRPTDPNRKPPPKDQRDNPQNR
jgi:hypothetical protein